MAAVHSTLDAQEQRTNERNEPARQTIDDRCRREGGVSKIVELYLPICPMPTTIASTEFTCRNESPRALTSKSSPSSSSSCYAPHPPTDEQGGRTDKHNNRTEEVRPRRLVRALRVPNFEMVLLSLRRACHSLSLGSRSFRRQVLRFLLPSSPPSSPFAFHPYATAAANGLDPKVKKSGTFISLM